MKTANIISRIPDFFLAQLVSFAFVTALTTSLGLVYPFLYTFIIIFAVTSLFCLAFTNTLSKFMACITVALLLIIAVVELLKADSGKLLANYFYWLSDFIAWPEAPDPLYQVITVVALCIVMSLITYFSIIKKLILFVPLVLGSAIFVFQWSYNLTTSMTPFYIFLPAILVVYFKHIHSVKSASAANEYLDTGRYTLWIVPVCALAVLLAAAIHASSKPIEWKWMDKNIASVFSYFDNKFDYQNFDYFSVASSGFGDKNSLLGGRVRLNKTQVLRVNSPHSIYLKGAAMDTYTGTKWINSSDETSDIGSDYGSLYGDTSEMLIGLPLLTGDNQSFVQNNFFKDKVSVVFQNLKTKSVFISSKLTSFKPAGNTMSGILDADGSFSSKTRLQKGFSYSMELFSPKFSSEDFIAALRKSKPNLYEEYLEKVESPSFWTSMPKATEQDSEELKKIRALQNNAMQVEAKYIQLPAELPQRVRDLALSITASSDNRYDKVKAIEQYLAGNFPYNLDVRSTPRYRDFVDYFLFDLKEGYCTYYASAMAILARSAGIPARYVEGYILPPKPIWEGSTTYMVSNMQAHAWVEVYFEGYGWLTFEPTSPFRSAFYTDDSITSDIGGNYNSSYEDYMAMMEKYTHRNDGSALDFGTDQTGNAPNLLLIFSIIVGAILALFILLISFNTLRSKLKLYTMLNHPPKDCILKLYDYFIKLLSMQGLGLEGGETPYQYSTRIDAYLFFTSVKFKAITEIFVKCRYSLNEASEKDKQTISDFSREFIGESRNNMGKSKFFFMKCILGRI